MALVSYQTITLSKGKHASPEDGACVMELASMLAGEPFNDRPQSVCPVIGSFLRAYNDRIDDGRRQDLYSYAAKVVGSRASQDVLQARAERLSAWALELRWSAWRQRLVPARLRALLPTPGAELIGSHAVCAIPQHDDKTHAEVLALIDELLAIGARKQPTTQRPTTRPLVVRRRAGLNLSHREDQIRGWVPACSCDPPLIAGRGISSAYPREDFSAGSSRTFVRPPLPKNEYTLYRSDAVRANQQPRVFGGRG